MKLYNRLTGVPGNHHWMLVRVISRGDFCGGRYEDEIIASAESCNELKEYCKLNSLTFYSPDEWAPGTKEYVSETVYRSSSPYKICIVPL